MTTHIVALSGGKDSTAMALRLNEVEPRDYIYVCTPTGDEPEEMFAHWKKLDSLLGGLKFISSRSLDGEIRRQRCLPNHRMRFCTRILKIEPYETFLHSKLSDGPVVSYVGLRADEMDRPGGMFDDLPGIKMDFPMQRWGWGITRVKEYLKEQGVEVPRRTDCVSCFWQTLPEWWYTWKHNPDAFELAARREEWVSKERGRKHTMRSPQRDTWPAGLRELGQEFEKGKMPRGVDEKGEAKLSRSRCRVCSM